MQKKTIPTELIKAIKDNKLVIFLGAGISMNEGLPSWKQILLNLLSHEDCDIEKAQSYYNALKEDIMEPLEVLEKIKTHKKYILQSFEKNLKVEDYSSEIFKTLAEISKRFVTTNFDKYIENNCSIKTIITHDSSYNLAKIGTSAEEYIIKLHGDLDRLDACIIFKEQFEELYNKDKLTPFQLKKLLSEYTFIFIGFSFNDIYVKELFGYMSSLMEEYGPKHYLVTTKDSEIKGIVNIKIENYTQLSILLNELQNIKGSTIEVKKKDKMEIEVLEDTDESLSDGSDIAPHINIWIGRQKELDLLKNGGFKVYFITGIGGEGKSSLASHYIDEEEKNFDMIDWRDFKEQEHKFQHKIYGMIKKVCPDIYDDKLVGLNDDQLITLFFKKLGNKKIAFVLDNVDSYIDLEKFEPIGAIGKLFNAALAYEHSSKFIFTCRPFIHYAGISFFQFKLEGLSEDNTIEYFTTEPTSIKREEMIEFAKKAFSLTKGHAMWLSLIIAHARRGKDKLIEFLAKIESGDPINENDSSIMSKRMLGNVWSTLTDRDKIVLRTMAESLVAETVEEYGKMIEAELNYNKFSKSIKALRNLNLIIDKRGTDYIELHPLVKEYIRTNYPSHERGKYIAMITHYYDQYVVILKERLGYKLSYNEYINFTHKAELLINAGKYQEALNTLSEVIGSMSTAGYIDELLRVSKMFFNTITWTKRNIEELALFYPFLIPSIKLFVENDHEEYTYQLLKEFESTVHDKSEAYLRLCSVKAYVYWFLKNYSKSLSICEEALYLMERGEQSDTFDIRHHYALTLRDSRKDENIEKALSIFLGDKILEKMIDKNNPITKDDQGTIFGNIGRCLDFLDDRNNALICYFKAFYFIFTYDDALRTINLGYASFWIYEVLSRINKNEVSIYFLKMAQNEWDKSSKVLLNQNQDAFSELTSSSTNKSINSSEAWRIEKYCIEFIEKQINVKFKIKN